MNNKQIIVVEDDPIFQAVYLDTLRSADAHFVTTSYRAQALMTIMEPDIVILDLGLPDGDGLEVIAALIKTYPYKDIPVIVVTSSTDAERHKAAIHAGANAVITKPFMPEQIRDAVTKYAL